LVESPARKRPFGRHWCRLDDIKIKLNEIEYMGVEYDRESSLTSYIYSANEKIPCSYKSKGCHHRKLPTKPIHK
jgi:hypothetical protein